MQINGLLPVGSVVLLKGSQKRLMIIGVCQQSGTDEADNHIYDYVGCLFPEGYMDSTSNFLFDGEQIERLYAIGYQDAEQLAFKEKADELLMQIRNDLEAE